MGASLSAQGSPHSSGRSPEPSCSQVWPQVLLSPAQGVACFCPAQVGLKSSCHHALWVSCPPKNAIFCPRLVIHVFPGDVINSMNGPCTARTEDEEVARSQLQFLITGLLSWFLHAQIASVVFMPHLLLYSKKVRTQKTIGSVL